MTQYVAETLWVRGDQNFLDQRYSRKHLLRFDGGLEVPGSSAPSSVPLPMSDAAALNPEEALVAATSSCHMLWFLSIAAKRKFRVDRYHDAAIGITEHNAQGKLFIARISLKPAVKFSGLTTPSHTEIAAMHREAHEECYIANSVRAEIVIESQP